MSYNSVDVDNLDVAISRILKDYVEVVAKATENALSAGEGVLISNLKASSPQLSGAYANSWKSKGKKYKMRRYVGNTKSVKGKKGNIPLSNLLEYGSHSPHQGLIKQTYYGSIEEITRVMINEIKKEV